MLQLVFFFLLETQSKLYLTLIKKSEIKIGLAAVVRKTEGFPFLAKTLWIMFLCCSHTNLSVL